MIILSEEYVIDGNIVDRNKSLTKNIAVFSRESEHSGEITFFFVDKTSKKVIKQLIVEADYGQACGYISNYKWSEPNE